VTQDQHEEAGSEEKVWKFNGKDLYIRVTFSSSNIPVGIGQEYSGGLKVGNFVKHLLIPLDPFTYGIFQSKWIIYQIL